MVNDLILYLTQKIVTRPEDVFLHNETNDKDNTIRLTVNEQDMGRIIGRKGRIIKSLLRV